ncbi:MAG: hypothetical protein IJO29_03160 [Oscillospiraceae bacterium]|nr:hypothetical protein [Oscillospiraceae bacterium]
MEDITNFSEQLVIRELQPADVFKRVTIIVGTALLSLALFFLGVVLTGWFFILWMLGIGAIYLGYRIYTSTYVEYEYIVTGNELDIDKIIAQRKRERLITVKLSKFKSISRSEEFEPSDDDATVVLAYGEDSEDWCAEVEHDSIGDVRLCFSPNKRTLLTMNQYLPAKLRLDIDESEE